MNLSESEPAVRRQAVIEDFEHMKVDPVRITFGDYRGHNIREDSRPSASEAGPSGLPSHDRSDSIIHTRAADSRGS
jgi:hypothetical protein